MPRSSTQVAGMALAMLLLMPAPAPWAQDGGPRGDLPLLAQTATTDDAPAVEAGVAITLSFVGGGLSEETLLTLKSVSRLNRERDEPVPSLFVLEQRIADDEDTLTEALRSLGYYDGRVEISHPDPPPGAPVPVTIAFTPGPLYMVSTTSTVVVVPADTDFDPRTSVDLLLRGARPADASVIQADLAGLVNDARDAGYRFAAISDDRYFLNREEKTLRIAVTLDLGPLVRLGGLEIEGLDRVQASAVERQITWQPGEVYAPQTLAAFRQRLVALNIFASVQADVKEPAEGQDPAQPMPVQVTLSESPPRTIGGEIAYDTDRGLFLGAEWIHRNLTGRADRLALKAETTGLIGGSEGLSAGVDATLAMTYTLQDFRRQDQDLDFQAGAELEQTEAYDSRAISAGVALRRRLDRETTVSLGLELEQSQIFETIDEVEEERFFSLVTLPATLRRDTTGSLLDPTSGYRLRATVEPTLGTGDLTLAFARAIVEGSAYYDVTGDERLVLAGRAGVGLILGSTLAVEDLPANRRFYAGGGGSVRGFSFQGIGPTNADGDPQGGLSRVEFNAEARIKVTDEIGVVPFVDAGYVAETPYPSLSDAEFAIGAGLGLRYYSPFGPIRLDVATPVTQGDDEPIVQVYVSIGQAF